MGYEVAKTFEDLVVYQRAFDISLVLHKETLTFPKIEQYALADQIRRASKSVCANIAEGFAKQWRSKAEFRRFLLMAMASANEMRVWMSYCSALGYVDLSQSKDWKEEYNVIGKMLNKLYSSSEGG